ncbi:MAG: hypothetical protein AB7G68_06935 [Nitrospiraceae bacterium]
MPSILTHEDIQTVIDGLPIQGRVMLRLMLLQHFDVLQEDIEYIAADRPDPRCVSGTKPTQILTRDAISSVEQRRDQYRKQVRLRRERVWLQIDTLRKLIRICEATSAAAKRLLAGAGMEPGAINELIQQARTAIRKPAMRTLDRRWEDNEITAEEYQKARLAIELQAQIRMIDKHRKRLELAEREWTSAHASPLLDHEIGHIWGIPAGSLLARKVKYLHQYLQGLHKRIGLKEPAMNPATTPPLDLWKETLAVLSERPVERSVATYDGLEKTEEKLLEKLHAFASGTLPEEVEGKFWLSLVHGASSNAVLSEPTRTVFGLQRLAAILGETDLEGDTFEQDLLARTAPTPKEEAALLEASPSPSKEKLSEIQEHILRSFAGEDRNVPQGW